MAAYALLIFALFFPLFSCAATYEGSRVPTSKIVLRGPNNLPFDEISRKYVGTSKLASEARLSMEYATSIGGKSLPVTVSRVLQASKLAPVLRVAARANPYLMVGITIADLVYDEQQKQWMKPEETGAIQGWYFKSSNPPEFGCKDNDHCSPGDAAQSLRAYYASINAGEVVSIDNLHCVSNCNGNDHNAFMLFNVVVFHEWDTYAGHQKEALGNFEVWGTFSANEPSSSGQKVPASDADMDAALNQHFSTHPDDLVEAAGRAMNKGYESDIENASDPATVTGPSSVDGGSKTSTTSNDAGITTTTTNTTYNVTYQGNTVNVAAQSTTSKTTPDGKTETTTETSSPSGSDESPPPPDLCEKYPDILACKKIPDVPENWDVPKEDKIVPGITPVISASGSCPAPIQLPILGHTYPLEYTPLCNLAEGVRPVVLALAWLLAGFIVVRSFKS